MNNSYYEVTAAIDDKVKTVAQQSKFDFFSATSVFCHDKRCRITVPIHGTWMPVVWDYGHLTEAGSIELAASLHSSRR